MLTAPPKVSPLEYEGMRFQQDRHTQFNEREFAATYLSAVDIKTGELLWIVKICDCLRYPPTPEILPVDFKKLALGPNEDELTIETTAGSRHVVDIKTHEVTLVYDPDWSIKPRVAGPVDESQPPMPPPWPRGRKK